MHYRLYGIDAPESKQEYGKQSTAAMSYLLSQLDNVVYVQSHGKEKYGRELATLFTTKYPDQDWQNLNYMMVALGHAWAYRLKEKEKRQGMPIRPALEQYEAKQIEARESRRGLWAQSNPENPQDYRRRKRLRRPRSE